MKKRTQFILFLFIAIGILWYALLSRPLAYDILLNTLEDTFHFKINIFYSDVTMRTISGFEVSKNRITPLKANFKSFTEGFLASRDYNRILSLINLFRQNRGAAPLNYFHDYYEDSSLIIVSFTGGLENIYVIDKQSFQVSKLHYEETDNLGKMYVSHIRRIADSLVLLGGEANAYNAFIYQIDIPTLSVKKAAKIATHPRAVHEEHYTIDASLNAVFINGTKLQVLSYKTGKLFDISLPFETDYVFSDDSRTIALSLNTSSLDYALFDSNLSLSHSGKLSLPSKNVVLVDAFLKDNYFYLISYDGSSNLYKNYISCYDLLKDKFIYCVGIRQYRNRALQDGMLSLSFDSIEN